MTPQDSTESGRLHKTTSILDNINDVMYVKVKETETDKSDRKRQIGIVSIWV